MSSVGEVVHGILPKNGHPTVRLNVHRAHTSPVKRYYAKTGGELLTYPREFDKSLHYFQVRYRLSCQPVLGAMFADSDCSRHHDWSVAVTVATRLRLNSTVVEIAFVR
jgi:hypothetical protein